MSTKSSLGSSSPWRRSRSGKRTGGAWGVAPASSACSPWTSFRSCSPPDRFLELAQLALGQAGIRAHHVIAEPSDGLFGVAGKLVACSSGGGELAANRLELSLDAVGVKLECRQVGRGCFGIGPAPQTGGDIANRLERLGFEGLLHAVELAEHLGGEHLEVYGLLGGLLEAGGDLFGQPRVLFLSGASWPASLRKASSWAAAAGSRSSGRSAAGGLPVLAAASAAVRA